MPPDRLLSRAAKPLEIAPTNSHDVTLSTPQADEGSGVGEIPLRRFLGASLPHNDTVWDLLTTISWALTSSLYHPVGKVVTRLTLGVY
jgi:hypothetical protein